MVHLVGNGGNVSSNERGVNVHGRGVVVCTVHIHNTGRDLGYGRSCDGRADGFGLLDLNGDGGGLGLLLSNGGRGLACGGGGGGGRGSRGKLGRDAHALVGGTSHTAVVGATHELPASVKTAPGLDTFVHITTTVPILGSAAQLTSAVLFVGARDVAGVGVLEHAGTLLGDLDLRVEALCNLKQTLVAVRLAVAGAHGVILLRACLGAFVRGGGLGGNHCLAGCGLGLRLRLRLGLRLGLGLGFGGGFGGGFGLGLNGGGGGGSRNNGKGGGATVTLVDECDGAGTASNRAAAGNVQSTFVGVREIVAAADRCILGATVVGAGCLGEHGAGGAQHKTRGGQAANHFPNLQLQVCNTIVCVFVLF
eukprot:comp22120_c0_seq1/m.32338 comp22120_c0_seq1/g.32338  ORF comp22120_c0_seq1/g.32338 comp22120_c0_seq1/m.32338 type:complete len:364 (+) comp22120_c0_seq1:889-1980(+)